MKIGTIEKIFDFLKANEGKELPREWVRLIKKTKLIKFLNYTRALETVVSPRNLEN